MKKFILLGSMVAITGIGCKTSTGELVGVQPRTQWFDVDPFGMLHIPMGSYNMGPSDEDIPYAHTTKSKTVSVQAFYMDQTEISNNEYRQFVFYVRDSLARRLLASNGFEDDYLIPEEESHGYEDNGPVYVDDDMPQDPYLPLNWQQKIRWDATDPDYKAALNDMYL